MGTREVSLRYCTVAGDEVRTTWEQARADLIVEGLPVRVPPTYRGQRNYPGLFWASTNRRTLVYESLLELDRLWLADFDPTVVQIATGLLKVRLTVGLMPPGRRHPCERSRIRPESAYPASAVGGGDDRSLRSSE